MSDATAQSHWERIAGEVPGDLSGRKVLDVRSEADPVSAEIESRKGTDLRVWDGAEDLPADAGGFDLVLCREALNRTAHPANFLSRLWAATAEGATLVIQCRVMTPVDLSMYARFVEAATGGGEFEWLPGRLAFRWSVETSGFDIERWIDSPALAAGPGEGDAYLVATRVARPPALDVSIPESPDR
jgi:hypothetical protein